jgi:uncharacterized delta-60 repeat protein
MPIATSRARFHLLLTALFLLPAALQAQQLDPGFHPPVFTQPATLGTPVVTKVVRQADGRILVAGEFQAVDGHATAGLARLLPDGQVDTTFTYRSTIPPRSWTALAGQADGKVLGFFYNSTQPSSLIRLLPSGQPDASFHPAILPPPGGQAITQVVVQPDGRLLVGGGITDSLGRRGLLRLLPSGRVDLTFNPPALPAAAPFTSMVLDPTGRITYATSSFLIGSAAAITRLLPSGRVDSSFVFTSSPLIHVSHLALCPDGGYALGGVLSPKTVARLLPNGRADTTFTASLDGFAISVGFSIGNPVAALAVQPDGRILACGNMYLNQRGAPILRAQRQGGLDTSFDPDFFYTASQNPYSGNVSNNARVSNLFMEPSGHLLVAGRFSQAGGVAHTGLARLLPAAPLATSAAVSAALQVWPVPAQDQLNVQLPANQPARLMELLDATGRTVLSQTPSSAAISLNTVPLPAGLYVLRVVYASGQAATWRVVVEH